MAKAVTATTGMWESSSSSFSHLVTSRPEISGSWMSHEDQVRLVLAGERQRAQPLAGLQSLVALGVQKVVEELHIELVILDDQGLFLVIISPATDPSAPLRGGRLFSWSSDTDILK